MDWLDDLLLTPQNAQIGRLQKNLRQARRSRRQRRRRTWALEQQVEELRLVALAMFELITEQTQISSEDLIARIEEIDIRDGVADGRKREAGSRPRCPECDRVLLQSLQACLYCGPSDPNV